MLRSLWSGVNGMQAHQIALDIESNNIANVNTTGFKYSRASFVDMLSQVKLIATSPYKNGLGGQNDFSVGLGVGVDATTKIFSQGNLQNTDVKTDLAIEGDGFFVISPDRGVTRNFTRSGEFLFDAQGSLVTTGGFVVQGWVRDPKDMGSKGSETDLLKIDNTKPLQNIRIDPGMVMPARSSTRISMRANLNAGRHTEQMGNIFMLDSSTRTPSDGVKPQYDSATNLTQVAEDMGSLFNEDGDAFLLNEDQGIWVSYKNATMKKDILATNQNSTLELNGTKISFTNDSSISRISTLSAAQNAINAVKNKTGVEAYIDNGQLRLENKNNLEGDKHVKNIVVTGAGTGAFAKFVKGDQNITAFRYRYTKGIDADSTTGQFKTTEDLRALMQHDANIVKDPSLKANYKDSTASVSVKINRNGMFEITNKDDGKPQKDNLSIFVTNYASDKVTKNVLFGRTMGALNTASLIEGGVSTSTSKLTHATHASSIDVVDSLGTKHTMRLEFYKTGGAEWRFRVIVPEPGEIVGSAPERPNVFESGVLHFNKDGSLAGMNPPLLQFNPHNGADSPQRITLNFGTAGAFDGITSVDKISETYAIEQNGYVAGDLMDVRFDDNGTLLGAFSNGKSLALAQVALANFANDAGLQADGGSVFSETSNSGKALIGAANTGRRGGVSGSKLESSNVDLSRSLTNLIVVQRGFQANSKAVTTSDQILNTLLNLKQ
ncbi:flagellar hook protein FlgE [Helicobacter ailurogastricus]|uniref:Flagellar hook protein FlgE n=1 Tax=Helicobacter ailurogastricus TaxID=1578720 RepID=A0A0K2XAJ9_9HELI|nr:flagellar hook protein FlgE [Helicobacter ailurogastricus]CRF41734.1 Flagellar hook protein FlgE [Helicobacter ailurogastricus]CRF42430.1 Flagellar hook protein FlgE [Helicobacter ailurogastricus]CRF43846.1 Flagellar hook protein FlgE [Helicobacter ailurogastricus]